MNILDAIHILDKNVLNPEQGLPEELFYYISRTVPLINVDLLIKDKHNRTLLIWRDDQYAGKGWHIPGGIIRFKETFEERIRKVCDTEIGSMVDFNPVPLAINEIIHPKNNIRGHFVSLLYECGISDKFIPDNGKLVETDKGYIKWHNSCPNNMVLFQDKIYRRYI